MRGFERVGLQVLEGGGLELVASSFFIEVTLEVGQFLKPRPAEHYKVPGLGAAVGGCPGGVGEDLADEVVVNGFASFKLLGKHGAAVADEVVDLIGVVVHGFRIGGKGGTYSGKSP